MKRNTPRNAAPDYQPRSLSRWPWIIVIGSLLVILAAIFLPGQAFQTLCQQLQLVLSRK
jgi:hypothetical protein